MTSVVFPVLRVVPLDRCVLHEETDGARVARLKTRLAHDGILRNPPVLGRHGGLEPLIVLDGATRTTALRELRHHHIVAQVVDYDSELVQLYTWSHLLAGLDIDTLLAQLAGDAALAVRPCSPDEAEHALTSREALAYLAAGDGRCFALGQGADSSTDAAQLRRVFAAYGDRATIARVPPNEWPAHLAEQPDGVAVVYPTFTKRDIVGLAQAGAELPAGITRHVIHGRALRVNVPILNRPQEEQQAWLDEWLRERQAGHGVRFYAESTFLFDE
jgi:hypothetical protein